MASSVVVAPKNIVEIGRNNHVETETTTWPYYFYATKIMMNASTSSPAPEENGASPLLLDRTMSLSTSTSDYTISSGSADEGTSLLNSDTERSSNYCTGDDDRLNSSSPADAASSSEEMTNPWPATFERSVMLLSKPFADRALVEYASESMHILPPTKLKKNVSKNEAFNVYFVIRVYYFS